MALFFAELEELSSGVKVSYQELMNVTTEPRAIHSDVLNSWTGKPEGVADHQMQQINIGGNSYNAFIASSADIDDTLTPELNSSNSAKNNAFRPNR